MLSSITCALCISFDVRHCYTWIQRLMDTILICRTSVPLHLDLPLFNLSERSSLAYRSAVVTSHHPVLGWCNSRGLPYQYPYANLPKISKLLLYCLLPYSSWKLYGWLDENPDEIPIPSLADLRPIITCWFTMVWTLWCSLKHQMGYRANICIRICIPTSIVWMLWLPTQKKESRAK